MSRGGLVNQVFRPLHGIPILIKVGALTAMT